MSAPTSKDLVRGSSRFGIVPSSQAVDKLGQKWDVAKHLVAAASPLQGIMDKARIQKEARKGASEAVMSVKSVEELERTPLWKQGDASLNTNDKLIQRAELRHHPDITAELQNWWVVAQQSMRSVHGDEYSATSATRDEYVKISRLLCKSMMQDFDSNEAERIAQEDFLHDAQGNATISREQFMDALFELADLWTKTIEPQEYVDFLHTLFLRIAKHDDGGTFFFWRQERDVQYGGYQDEEENEDQSEYQTQDQIPGHGGNKNAHGGRHHDNEENGDSEADAQIQNRIPGRRGKESPHAGNESPHAGKESSRAGKKSSRGGKESSDGGRHHNHNSSQGHGEKKTETRHKKHRHGKQESAQERDSNPMQHDSPDGGGVRKHGSNNGPDHAGRSHGIDGPSTTGDRRHGTGTTRSGKGGAGKNGSSDEYSGQSDSSPTADRGGGNWSNRRQGDTFNADVLDDGRMELSSDNTKQALSRSNKSMVADGLLPPIGKSDSTGNGGGGDWKNWNEGGLFNVADGDLLPIGKSDSTGNGGGGDWKNGHEGGNFNVAIRDGDANSNRGSPNRAKLPRSSSLMGLTHTDQDGSPSAPIVPAKLGGMTKSSTLHSWLVVRHVVASVTTKLPGTWAKDAPDARTRQRQVDRTIRVIEAYGSENQNLTRALRSSRSSSFLKPSSTQSEAGTSPERGVEPASNGVAQGSMSKKAACDKPSSTRHAARAAGNTRSPESSKSLRKTPSSNEPTLSSDSSSPMPSSGHASTSTGMAASTTAVAGERRGKHVDREKHSRMHANSSGTHRVAQRPGAGVAQMLPSMQPQVYRSAGLRTKASPDSTLKVVTLGF